MIFIFWYFGNKGYFFVGFFLNGKGFMVIIVGFMYFFVIGSVYIDFVNVIFGSLIIDLKFFNNEYDI